MRPQGWTEGVAVLARGLVRTGAAVLLRRPRHDREPAGAGDVARKRADGARHYQHRARRLRSERREQQHRGLELAGGSDVRVVTRGSSWEEPDRPDRWGRGPRLFQGRFAALSGIRARPDRRAPPRDRSEEHTSETP